MYAGARLTVGNAGSYESVLAGGRTVSGRVQRSGSPQDLPHSFSPVSSLGTQLGAAYAVDGPLRANEWMVAVVGRSKILRRQIKSQTPASRQGRYRGITTVLQILGEVGRNGTATSARFVMHKCTVRPLPDHGNGAKTV